MRQRKKWPIRGPKWSCGRKTCVQTVQTTCVLHAYTVPEDFHFNQSVKNMGIHLVLRRVDQQPSYPGLGFEDGECQACT